MKSLFKVVLFSFVFLIFSYAYGTVTEVEAGIGTLEQTIENAQPGDTIALITSGGKYLDTTQVVIDKDLVIMGAENLANKPIIEYVGESTSAYIFKVVGSPKVTIANVEINGDGTADGAAAKAKYALRLDNEDPSGSMVIKVYDCVMHDFNEKIIKPYANCGVDSLIVRSSIFYNGAKEGITLYSGSSSDPAVILDYAEITNCTFYNFAREAIKGDTYTDAKVRINHCTIYNCGGTSKSMMYFDDMADVEVKNSLFVSNSYDDYFARFESEESIFKYNGVWDVLNPKVLNATVTDTFHLDPLFQDPDNGDFYLAENSPARGKADDGHALGDLRWEEVPGKYILSVVIEGEGSYELDPPGGVYDPGTEVTITAIPETGWKIDHWEPSNFPPDGETMTVTMDGNKTVVIVFVPMVEELSYDVVGIGHLEFDPAPIDTTETGFLFKQYDDIQVTAVSDTTSMAFKEWQGDVISTDNPITVSMDSSIFLLAVFEPVVPQCSLNVEIIGLGDVIQIPEPYEFYETYDKGTEVMLVAEPFIGWEFDGWSGDTTSTEDTIVVTLDSTINIVANFSEIQVAGGRIEIEAGDSVKTLYWAMEYVRNTSVDTIVLATDGGVYEADEFINVNTNVTIMAKEGLAKKPIIKGNPDPSYSSGIFQIKVGEEQPIRFSLIGVEAYGAKYTVRTDDDTVRAIIKVDSCYFHDAGEVLVKVYPKSFVDSLIITNTKFRDCGKEGIYLKEPNTIGYLKVENCTFIHIAREAIRVRDNDDMTIFINHCTFDSTDYDKDYRMIYPEGVNNVTIRNCIFANQLGSHSEVFKLYGESVADHILLWNTATKIGREGEAWIDEETIWSFDPKFVDPSTDDYTLSAESHAYDIASDGLALGDLNWATEEPIHVFLTVEIQGNGEVSMDPPPVGLSYDPGTMVTLVADPDSGWVFKRWEGDITGSDNPVSVEINDDMHVVAVFEVKTGISEEAIPVEYELSQNYPNPFNASTVIKFAIKEEGHTTLSIYDLMGREVMRLIDEVKKPGYYQVYFNASKLPSGVYFYRLESGDFVSIKKMLLVK